MKMWRKEYAKYETATTKQSLHTICDSLQFVYELLVRTEDEKPVSIIPGRKGARSL